MKRFLTSLLVLISVAASAAEPTELLHNTAAHVYAANHMGSGGIIQSATTGRKYLLTNWHVCRNVTKNQLIVFEMETGESKTGRVVYSDPIYDLCLVEVDQYRPAIQIGSSISVGDEVYSHSYPKGKFIAARGKLVGKADCTLDVLDSAKSVCPRGFNKHYNVYHLLDRCTYDYPSGITSLYADGGSSGSAVVNNAGELVGVIQSSTGGYNDAGIILLDRIQKFMVGH